MDQSDRPPVRGRRVATIAAAGVIACTAALAAVAWADHVAPQSPLLLLSLALLLVGFAGRAGTRD